MTFHISPSKSCQETDNNNEVRKTEQLATSPELPLSEERATAEAKKKKPKQKEKSPEADPLLKDQ